MLKVPMTDQYLAGLDLIPGRPDPLKNLSHLCGPLHGVEGHAD
jgi:hypothetical protein